MSVNFEIIGSRIQKRRKILNKTQENLAEYLDVSVGYVSLIERGKTKIALDTLARICDFLSCSIGDLTEDISKKNLGYLNSEIIDKINSLNSSEKEILHKLIDTYIKYKNIK